MTAADSTAVGVWPLSSRAGADPESRPRLADFVDLADLVESYGSPLYVYDLAEARRAYADLRAALPAPTDVYYSLKANPHPGLVAALVASGAHAEVCSTRELDVALGGGAAASECLYTGPGKTTAEITDALRRDVRQFSVDSPTDIARLGWCARAVGVTARAILRLNPSEYPSGAGLAMGGLASQFGADVSWVRARPDSFAADGVDLVGYHVYVGTNVAAPADLVTWFTLALDAVQAAQDALGLQMRLVDLGGGFGHPYARPGVRPDLSALRRPAAALLDARLPTWRTGWPRVAFESGRYLVAAAGTLLVTVSDVKDSKDARFVITDGGINVLGGMSGLRRVPPLMAGVLPVGHRTDIDQRDGDQREILPGVGGSGVPADHYSAGAIRGANDTDTDGQAVPTRPARVTGPLCTALDILGHAVPLPEVSQGTVLMVPNTGAYGLTASLVAFLSRDAPVEVVVDGGHVRAATRPRLVHEPVAPRGAHPNRVPTATGKATGKRT